MSAHTCHARNCATPCKPEFLMCPRHWRMVPANIQAAVWATYRPGQCNDKRPSKEWHLAAERAIVSVAVKERLITKAAGEEHILRYEARLFPGRGAYIQERLPLPPEGGAT